MDLTKGLARNNRFYVVVACVQCYGSIPHGIRAYRESCVRGLFHLIPLLNAEPVDEQDGELGLGGGPFALDAFPVLTDTAQHQVQ
ncbi:MAG: hypothetical protein P4L90_04915 [Rhodopila sp.]|nr:hypothetical protein [Rhodopila sp.]